MKVKIWEIVLTVMSVRKCLQKKQLMRHFYKIMNGKSTKLLLKYHVYFDLPVENVFPVGRDTIITDYNVLVDLIKSWSISIYI